MSPIRDIAFVRYQVTDLSPLTPFLQDFGLPVVERTASALYSRTAGPGHHAYIAEVGPENATIGFGLYARSEADLALVVGGYNSSNTSHIVELVERHFTTFFINAETEIKSKEEIQHFDFHAKEKRITHPFLPDKRPLTIALTSGASCPDTVVDRVMLRLLEFFENPKEVEKVLSVF